MTKTSEPLFLDHIQNIFLFSERKVYSTNPNTDAFEIKNIIVEKNEKLSLT